MNMSLLQKILSDLSMKQTPTLPSTAFRFGQLDGSGYWIQVVVGDSREEWKGRKWLISFHSTESEVILTALKAVLTFLEHEVRESFLYKNLALFHPHPNLDDLLEIADRKQLRDKGIQP